MFIDSDHVLDYLDWILRGHKRYMLVLFHAWEYSLIGLGILAGLWYHPVFLAAVLGHIGHVTADSLANSTHPLAYSIMYRVSRGFRLDKLTRTPTPVMPESGVPLWARIEPWLWRLIHRD